MSAPFDLPAQDWMRAAFSQDPNPSFIDLVRRTDPGLLPRAHEGATAPALPHGTTILSLRFAGGIVMAGDRRATEGYSIADRRMEKVYAADRHSAVAIAGAAGPAIDMVRLLQLELEHYEKLEGEQLSLEGKANRLATMIKTNFPMAMQGIVVVPIFAGYDVRRAQGRIFRYDAIGGRYEETEYHATGSGGTHARGTLKKRFRPDADQATAVRAAVEALMDAAEEDAATGGPDLGRGIFPIVALVTAEGYETATDDELRAVTQELLAERGRAS
jgi:proteasome beta subunit